MHKGEGPTLNQAVSRVRILVQREDTGPLVSALEREGLATSVIRPVYTAEQEGWARNTKCLWGHRAIWQEIADAGESMCMVCEADFVPCVGLGSLPLPFHLDDAGDALGYLYAGGAEVFDMHHGRYARGHASCTVAYVLGAHVARRLIQFADAYIEKHGTAHSLWECEMGWSVKASGVKSWMPFRHYGEHGGIPNMEHARHGFNPSHQSDTLYGPLHFLPVYARGSRVRFGWMRMKARSRGIGRLLFHRYVHIKDLQRARASGTLGVMLKFAVSRHAYLF